MLVDAKDTVYVFEKAESKAVTSHQLGLKL